MDKVLEHLMTSSLTVAGGDRLGKTIIFAKNQAHAEYIAERFDVHYPHLRGEFARAITFKTEYAQSLIDSFSAKDKPPHIAISVDMLDTGIDVRRSSTSCSSSWCVRRPSSGKCWGAARLCADLFGPDIHKELFNVFDYCQNLEYFSQDLPAAEGATPEPLGKRLFKARLELIAELDVRRQEDGSGTGKRYLPTWSRRPTSTCAAQPRTCSTARWRR